MDKGRFGRKDRIIKEKRHDTYRWKEKPPAGTVCSRCGASYENGRWTWNRPSCDTLLSTCPACLRIADHYPAGRVKLSGDFFARNRREILNLVRNIEEKEKTDRPLERIMQIRKEGPGTLITTTGVHVARRIGEALYRSYRGAYSLQYEDGDKRVNVRWER